MAKQSAQQTTTEIDRTKGVGRQVEKSVTMDDCCLPNANELEAYKAIDPNIVSFLMETSKKEQEHRHQSEKKQLEIIQENNKFSYNINNRGIIFAFLLIVISLCFSGFLLYLDKNIAGSIFGSATLLTTMAIFRPRSKKKME